MAILTLGEFRLSVVEVENLVEHYRGWIDKDGEGWVYADGVAYINKGDDGHPFLVIGNQQWNGDLGYLERILYFEHYFPEYSNAG